MKKAPEKKKKTPMKMAKKSTAKKELKGGQNKLPMELQKAIKASPGKMLKPAAMKFMGAAIAATAGKRKVKRAASSARVKTSGGRKVKRAGLGAPGTRRRK